jgi:hypothetical protein
MYTLRKTVISKSDRLAFSGRLSDQIRMRRDS